MCIYIYIYLHIHTHTHIYIYIYMFIYVNMYVYVYINIRYNTCEQVRMIRTTYADQGRAFDTLLAWMTASTLLGRMTVLGMAMRRLLTSLSLDGLHETRSDTLASAIMMSVGPAHSSLTSTFSVPWMSGDTEFMKIVKLTFPNTGSFALAAARPLIWALTARRTCSRLTDSGLCACQLLYHGANNPGRRWQLVDFVVPLQ